MTMLRAALTALALTACPLHAQDATGPREGRAPVPFAAGERAEYQVKFGFLSVGSASMDVVGIDTVRGQETWNTIFQLRGGIPGYRVNYRFQSWMHTRSLASLRHWQIVAEGRRDAERKFEIFPGEHFIHNEFEPQPTVQLPLDDGSFFQFVRTLPLDVGAEYSFNRYFRPDRNPVVIQILRRERVRVPAGTFDAVVLRPIIKSRGVFSEDGQALVWLTDDDRRIMVQMKTRLSFGSITLQLRNYRSAIVDSSASASP